MSGHDTQTPGGDLAIGRLSVADLVSFTRIMPAHLSRAEVAAVATYVHSVAQARNGR